MNEISAPVAPVAADTTCVGSYSGRVMAKAEERSAPSTCLHTSLSLSLSGAREEPSTGQSPLIKRLRHSAMLVLR